MRNSTRSRPTKTPRCPPLLEARKQAEAAEQAALEALQRACQTRRTAAADVRNLTVRVERARGVLRKQLAASTDNDKIRDFDSQLRELRRKLRDTKPHASAENEVLNYDGYRVLADLYSNQPSIVRRFKALNAADEQVEQLRYSAVDDPDEAFRAILDGLPVVEVEAVDGIGQPIRSAKKPAKTKKRQPQAVEA